MTPTNVLIIDDSRAITKLIAKILLSNKISERFFHEDHIYFAYDGMEAFEVLSKHPDITLVISDVIMPELNGEELIEMLIDTGKIKSLEVIFITTPINKNIISKSIIKQNINGVIYKPFNADTFSIFFNKMQQEHNLKIQNQQKIKLLHVKQMRYIKTWVQDYSLHESIEICQKTLGPIIASEFEHFDEIDNYELYMVYQSVLENYIHTLAPQHALNCDFMKKIYNMWHQPHKYKTFGISDDFNDMLSSAQEVLNETSTADDLRHSFVLPLNNLLVKIKNRAKVKDKLPYNDFAPYIQNLIEQFLELDDKYQNSEVLAILNHMNEMKKFEEDLMVLSKNGSIVELFAQLKTAPHLMEVISNHIATCIKYIQQQIVTLYMYKANELAWQKAKNSPKIREYLKNNLKQKMINTHNLLYQRGVIDKSEIKIFQKYDRERIIVISRDLEVLEVLKKNMVSDMPSLEITIFRSISILKNDFARYNYKRLVVDISFTNSVFHNGFELVKLLNKRYPAIEKIIQSGFLYFIVTPSQVKMLEKNRDKIKFDYQLLLKPLNSKKVFEQFYLQN